jgi:hypothetical protein
MHEDDSQGVLTGTREQLALDGRCSVGEIVLALSELSTSGAADISERNGTVTIVNRRMKREAEIRSIRAAAGRKGGANTQAKIEQDCISAFASELESEKWFKEKDFETAFEEFLQHRIELKKPMTDRAKLQAIRIIKPWGKDRAIQAIRTSISNGWQGLFEPRSNGASCLPGNTHRERWQIDAEIASVKSDRARIVGVYTIETLRQERSPKCKRYDELTADLHRLEQEKSK